MSQTQMVDDPAQAFAGLVYDVEPKKTISRIANTMQLVEVEVTGTTDGDYKILADGVEQAGFTASTNTEEEIRDGLLADYATTAAVEADAEASGTDKALIEQTNRDSTTDITWTVSGPGGPDITVTVLVAQAQRIPFGVGVVVDPRESSPATQCRLPRLTGEITAGTFLGIAAADTSLPNDDGLGYESQKSVQILRKGEIWVVTEDACVQGGQVFCRFQDPTADYGLGSFRSDADTADAVAVPGAMFMYDSDADGLNRIELNPTR